MYDVNVKAVSGNGTIGLDFAPNNSITDLTGHRLGPHPIVKIDQFFIIGRGITGMAGNDAIIVPGVIAMDNTGNSFNLASFGMIFNLIMLLL